jgi:hypothetical protein
MDGSGGSEGAETWRRQAEQTAHVGNMTHKGIPIVGPNLY